MPNRVTFKTMKTIQQPIEEEKGAGDLQKITTFKFDTVDKFNNVDKAKLIEEYKSEEEMLKN